MGKKWGLHARDRDQLESSVLTEREGEWWMSDDEPTKVINRRWRRDRPDGPHRRRATDHPPAVEDRPPLDDRHATTRSVEGEPFDADALFREMDAEPDQSLVDSDAPWTTLGLTPAATWGEVVARQRELAKLHHPDRTGGEEPTSEMADINAAVTELSRIYRVSGEI